MSTSIGLPPAIVSYLADVNPPEHPVLGRCRAETASLGRIAGMQISAEQGALMQVLARLVNAKRGFEIGVFTGYSSTAVALTMKELHGGGYLLACDISEDWTSKARGCWKDAGVDGIVDLQLRPATQTMDEKLAAGQGGTYDIGFIDADKEGYDSYYERGLALLRPGGLMLFDNVLWQGKVADPAVQDEETRILRAVGQKAKTDPRVHAAMTSVGDGLLFCVKK